MQDIRLEIINNARELFKTKGYASTSIQDVLDKCNISRGSFYRFFKAKEDLFLEIYRVCHDELMDQIITLSDAISDPTELLKKSAYLLLDFFVSNANIVHKMDGFSSEQVLTQRKKFGIWVIMTFKKQFLAVYGPELEDYVYDVLMYQRTLNSGYIRIIFNGLSFGVSVADVARREFVLLDNYARYNIEHHPTPLTPKEVGMLSYPEDDALRIDIKSMKSWTNIREKLLSAIESQTRRKDLEDTLNMLMEELKKKEPRHFLINVLLNYLMTEDALREYAMQIQKATDYTRYNNKE